MAAAESSPTLGLTITAPVYQEVENLPELAQRLIEAGRATGLSFEVVLVDDGSRDGSADLLRELCQKWPELRALILRGNYGQSAAMTAGFAEARGAIVVSLDGDLQNEPADIPMLVAKLNEGYDVVCGWRKDRQDRMLDRKLPSRVANWLIRKFTRVPVHDLGCALRAYRREFVADLVLYGQLHRFIPVLLTFERARIAEVPTRHHPRTRGQSKYNLSRLPRVTMDLLLMVFFRGFSTRPLQFFGWPGGLMGVSGFGVLLFLTSEKLLRGVEIGGRPLLLLGVLLLLTGIILVGLGLVAELVVRVRHEAGGKKIYAVRERLGQPTDAR